MGVPDAGERFGRTAALVGATPRPPRSGRRPWAFLGLVVALSVPYWIAASRSRVRLLPGLPPSALALVNPVIAASMLVARKDGAAGVRALLRRSADWHRIRSKWWLVPAALIMPATGVLTYALAAATGPAPPPPGAREIGWALLLVPLFLIAALAEELGWSGYATEPLQRRWGALTAALILGVVWAAWHFVPLIQAGRTAGWIGWWSLGTVAQRVLIVWLFDNTGHSVFATAVFHASGNFFTIGLADYYDPRLTGLILAVAAAAVVAGWGPRTLTGRRGEETAWPSV